jgi:uncharacterized RDD family membrane protein YckC
VAPSTDPHAVQSGVGAHFLLANISRRLFAMVIDQLIVLGFVFVIVFVGALFTGDDENSEIGAVLGLWWLLSVWLYFALFVAFSNGATPGKKLMKIRVVRTSGGTVGFGRATVRFLARWIPFGPFFALFNDRKQTLHDLIADTVVVPRGLN